MRAFAGSTREFLLLTAVFVLGHIYLLLEVLPRLHRAMAS